MCIRDSRYVADVKKNKTAFVEYQKFRSKMFPDVVRRIAGRLFVDSLNFSDGKFDKIWICDNWLADLFQSQKTECVVDRYFFLSKNFINLIYCLVFDEFENYS